MNAANDAAADGRALDAIELLSQPDHLQVGSAAQQRLVELRHAAFGELDRSPGRPCWPTTFADPYPAERGVPETRREQLSGALIGGAIVNHGCLRVNGLLAEDAVARFCDHIERSFAARQRVADGAPLASAAPWFVPFAPGQAKADGFGHQAFIRVVDSPPALCDLVEVFSAAGVTDAVTDYFMERPAMIANKWVLRRSPTGKIGTDFHQDGAFLGEGIRTVDCWISLSHCGPGTGRPGIDLVPRRFDSILPSGDDAAFGWSLTEHALRSAAPGVETASPVFRPGDALFFDERLPHRTTVGLDLSVRYAIESWFVAPSSYPARHVPIVL